MNILRKAMSTTLFVCGGTLVAWPNIYGQSVSSINATLVTINSRLAVRHSGAVQALNDSEITLVSGEGTETFRIDSDTVFCFSGDSNSPLDDLAIGDVVTATTIPRVANALSLRNGGLTFSISQFGVSADDQEPCDQRIVALMPSTIRRAQQALAKLGINPGPVDGQWGKSTRRAVDEFQRTQGLQETGYLDLPTREKLNLN